MFAVCVTITLKPNAAEAFMPHMLANARNSLASEPGCLQFDVCLDPQNPRMVFLYELYDSPDGFQAHLETDHYRSFDAAVARMIDRKAIQKFAEVHR